MTAAAGPDGQPLISWVRRDFGLDLVTVDRVLLGADANADMWRGTAAGGAAYAVKLSGGGTPAGLVVCAHLARHGVTGVPVPLTTAAGRLWSDRAGRRLSVQPWVSDLRGNGAMTARRWTAFGALLARVHAMPVEDEVAEVLPRETFTHDLGAGAVRTVQRRLGLPTGPGDPGATPADTDGTGAGHRAGGPDHVGAGVAEAWTPAAGEISALVAHADSLGARLRARPAPGVVCHGDPHLANVLLGDGGQVWLIDWDDAVLAPRELDLMLLLGGMGPFGPVTDGERARLFDGYGDVDLDPELVAYFRCRRALEDVGGWAEQALDSERWTLPERERALAVVRVILAPGGMVPLALGDL